MQAIDEYTVRTWGEAQADLYLDQIRSCCQPLAESPGIGSLWSKRRPALRRMEQGSHIICYPETPQGILVYRVLHPRTMPIRQPFHDTVPTPATTAYAYDAPRKQANST